MIRVQEVAERAVRNVRYVGMEANGAEWMRVIEAIKMLAESDKR
jgi:hypothetical protein